MNFLRLLLRNLAAGPATEAFPFAEAKTPKRYRGRVRFKAETCTTCRSCEQVCAPGAIRFDKTPEGMRFSLWHNTCIFCGLCQHYCPTDAIELTTDWHLAHAQEKKFSMVEQGMIPYVTCTSCGTKALASAVNPKTLGHPATDEEIEKLRNLCPGCRRKAIAAMGVAA